MAAQRRAGWSWVAGGLLALRIALAPSAAGGVAHAQAWVEPWTALRPAPVALEDAREPLAARIELARALGRHGPERDAVTALLAALEHDPPPALRDELLRALARRAPAAARVPLLSRLRAAGPKPPELGLALAAVADGEITAALIEALGRPEDATLARATLLAMAERGAPALGEALAGAHALAAVSILRELGPLASTARPALERALRHGTPALAVEAALALGALGDARSAAQLAERVRTGADAALTRAALSALVSTATPAQSALLLQLSSRGGGDPSAVETRALALRALAHAAPAAAAPQLVRALREADPRLRAAARESLLGDLPDTSFVPALTTLARQGDEAAASALSRVAGGAGVRALLAIARSDARHAERCARPLALALRRFEDELDDALVKDVRALLFAQPKGPRTTLLRALAGEPSAPGEARTQHGADADARAAAAAALSLTPDESRAPEVLAALEREREPEVARRLCDAARALGARPDARTLDRLVHDPETAPEALTLWAWLERQRPSRALRVALRRALDPRSSPCTRAAAAMALGAQRAAGDTTAEVPLLALLADPVPRLRLSAVLALGTSRSARVLTARAQHARIERDTRVRAAIAKLTEQSAPPQASSPRPLDVLELRVRSDDAIPRLLEVWLEDGRCLRQRTLPGGELVIAQVPAGEADVRVID